MKCLPVRLKLVDSPTISLFTDITQRYGKRSYIRKKERRTEGLMPVFPLDNIGTRIDLGCRPPSTKIKDFRGPAQAPKKRGSIYVFIRAMSTTAIYKKWTTRSIRRHTAQRRDAKYEVISYTPGDITTFFLEHYLDQPSP